MLQGAPQLVAKLNKLRHQIDGVAETVAKESRLDVEQAVKADIGDSSMSGWRRGKPIQIYGAYKVLTQTTAEITPARMSAGPMRVLESGRNAHGGVGGFQGPGINFRTGKTSARARTTGRGSTKGRRYNGKTRGKDTWSDAEKLIVARLPKRSSRALRGVMSNIFHKG